MPKLHREAPVQRLLESSSGTPVDRDQIQIALRLVRQGYYEGKCDFCKPGSQDEILVKAHPSRLYTRACIHHQPPGGGTQ